MVVLVCNSEAVDVSPKCGHSSERFLLSNFYNGGIGL